MSLFGSIQLGANSLRADQVAMQVVGQNIANASTPGYIREEAVLTPASGQRIGNYVLGLGVEVEAIVQKIDKFLEERLRGAVSDSSSAEAQQNTYTQLEQLIGGLNDTGVGATMTKFFDSISLVLNQPEDVSARNQVILDAGTLTQQINTLASGVKQVRADVNTQVESIAGEINQLTKQISSLNAQIMQTEASAGVKSDAVGLRDQRQVALESLAKLVKIRVKEHDTGSVAVYVGSDFLVNDGITKQVWAAPATNRGMLVADIRFVDTDSPLETSAGELHGLLTARDDVLGGFLENLDDFAGTLAFEFNKIFASGQGLRGYDSLTSQSLVTAPDAPLDEAGLKFTPVNGSFQLLVYDTKTKTTRSVDIPVHLLGDSSDTTLQSLADTIDKISPLSATATPDGRLSIASLSGTDQFAFANDTSGLLAALGVNTLFTGSTASDLGVNQAIASDPAKFAASTGGIGVDSNNAVKLAQFIDQPIASHNDESITTIFDRIVARVTQDSAVTKSNVEATKTFEQTLRSQELAISGVSIDEEAINMLTIQKAYQASARFIATIKDLLDTLMQI